jgi:hypothetical protein
MAQVESNRPIKRNTVKTYLCVMEKEGKVRRVRKTSHKNVLYAFKSFKTPDSAFGAKSQWEVAEALIQQHGPLKIDEIIVKMHEGGYRTDTTMPRLKKTLCAILNKRDDLFVQDQQCRWMLTAISFRMIGSGGIFAGKVDACHAH